MKTDFKPLRQDAVEVLSAATRCDFRRTEFSNDEVWFCCTVRDEFEQVALVIVFEFKNSFDAHVSTVLIDHRALTRRLLTTILRTVFKRAKRLTALIEDDNIPAMRQVWRLGFRHEGFLRRGFDGARHAMLFGLLPEECPYLAGRPFTFVYTPVENLIRPPQMSVH